MPGYSQRQTPSQVSSPSDFISSSTSDARAARICGVEGAVDHAPVASDRTIARRSRFSYGRTGRPDANSPLVVRTAKCSTRIER